MDYKYIEQLLERYWECATSPEEENVLHAFFTQKDIPEGLKKYRHLFIYEQSQKGLTLDDSFDEKVLSLIESDEKESDFTPHTVKALHVTWSQRLRPMFRAVAAVAIVTLLGTAAQHSFRQSDASQNGWDYNSEAYKDTYTDPQKAYEAGIKSLRLFKTGAQTAAADTTTQVSNEIKVNEANKE